jgi:hypothetical protein
MSDVVRRTQNPNIDALKPYYEELIAAFSPAELRW